MSAPSPRKLAEIQTYRGFEVAGRRVRAPGTEHWKPTYLNSDVPFDWVEDRPRHGPKEASQ